MGECSVSDGRRLARAVGKWQVVGMGLLLAAFVVAFLRTAWMAEDAFITFRAIENAIAGLGLVWNPGERVQVYTHPLWYFLLMPFVAMTGDPYWSALALSFLLYAGTLILLIRLAGMQSWARLVPVVALLFSRSFIDYSSSGLENPLSHILLAGFFSLWLQPDSRRNTFLLSLVFSALFLTRPDAIVLVMPALLWRVFQRRDYFPALWGITPIAAWMAFSLIYYGVAVPNTALAKVGTGVSLAQSLSQGVSYLQWSVLNDPISVILLMLGVAAGLLDPRLRPLALGLLAWNTWLFVSGADYMGGRFYSAPVVLAVCLLVEAERKSFSIFLILAMALSYSVLGKTVLSPPSYHDAQISRAGIADERGFYYSQTGLLPAVRRGSWRAHPWLHIGQALRNHPGLYTRCAIGMTAYAAGPTLHWIDPLALSDPFLSRLPARSGTRVGHYERAFPKGYLDLQGDLPGRGRAGGAVERPAGADRSALPEDGSPRSPAVRAGHDVAHPLPAAVVCTDRPGDGGGALRHRGDAPLYRGLAKNAVQVLTLFALSNLWMARRRLLQLAG